MEEKFIYSTLQDKDGNIYIEGEGDTKGWRFIFYPGEKISLDNKKIQALAFLLRHPHPTDIIETIRKMRGCSC